MNFSKLLALGVGLGLFVTVYIPAFAAVSLLRTSAEIGVPLIIGISLAISLALIFILARGTAGVAAFGFCLPNTRYVGLAFLFGLPLAFAAGGLIHLFPSASPIDTTKFPIWMLWLYFGFGAAIQEEIIFRGLIQSFLEHRWTTTVSVSVGGLSVAVLFTGILFGVIHLDSGPVVVPCAIVLGLVAGELRRRSGSLIPAVIVHALFNVPDLIWR